MKGDCIGVVAHHWYLCKVRIHRLRQNISERGRERHTASRKLLPDKSTIMSRYNFLLCLMVLICLGLSGSDEPNIFLPPTSEMPTDVGLSLLDEEAGAHECSACVWREQSKVLRLETIKSQILSKLRLKQAPNISREVVNQLLPKAPPLQQLLDHHDFQGDASSQDEFMEEDEYHATTESVITMASERE